MADPIQISTDGSNSPDSGSVLSKKRQPFVESHELVIGYSGPVGSGVNVVANFTKNQLELLSYKVHIIKVSDLIIRFYQDRQIGKLNFENINPKDRYSLLQKAGNEIREKYKQNHFLAELVVSKIAYLRNQGTPNKEKLDKNDSNKVAYLIDQLKRPEEVDYLKKLYRNLYYSVGVFSNYHQVIKSLTSGNRMSKDEAVKIFETDRAENSRHGQELEKTLQLSDLFIRNTSKSSERIKSQLARFFDLVHGRNGITPTKHEYAMYVAYSAGLGSACLSRQVGACITTEDGNILATGCNDVPKPGGGLYSEDDAENDQRCVHIASGKCFNQIEKNKKTSVIRSVIQKSVTPQKQANEMIDKIILESELNNLIEFSRSVHAEMAAIMNIARNGNISTVGTTLYSTTYPCHSCARHIIAAGIKRVFYIEPYTKSLALDLHEDAIVIDPEEDLETQQRVQFFHFEGVSPRQFQGLFYNDSKRKDSDGNALRTIVHGDNQNLPELMYDYKDREAIVFKGLIDMADIDPKIFSE